MALSLVRRSILCQIRAQTQTLNGRLRSLSSTTCDSLRSLSSIGEDQINSSLRTQPSDADPRDNVDQINFLASLVTRKVNEIIKYGEPPFPLLFGAEVYAYRFDDYVYTEVIRWKCMLRVIYFIKDFPEVDKIQIFHAYIYYESLLRGDSKCELTKDEIIARVLNVIQCYPKVGDDEVVTEETHFRKDLGFDMWDVTEIIQALQVEFKLDIPDDIDSCKLAIEYIYDHRMEKLCLEEFRKRFHFTRDSGRRIYLRADEKMGTKDTMLESGHDKQRRETNWDGINLSQFFMNMQSNYYPGMM